MHGAAPGNEEPAGYEETGLEVEITGLLDVIDPEPSGAASIVVVYWAHIVGGDLRAGDDVDQAG